MQRSESNGAVAASTPPLSGDVAPWLARGPVLDVPPAMAALALPSRRFPGSPPCADADRAWDLFITHARTVREADTRIEQGVRAGSLLYLPRSRSDIDEPELLSALDPIAASELIRDMQGQCA